MSGGDERRGVAGEVIELDRLITMANQIGDFFAPYPPERAREGAAQSSQNLLGSAHA